LNAIDPPLYSAGLIWSSNFVERVSDAYKKRKQELPSKPELPTPETELPTPETELLTPETTQRKGKERKGNKNNSISLFEKFWIVYPKKRKKEAALKAWSKLPMTDELLDTILKAVEKQSKTPDWTKDDGQFIPYPATWLNGHQWEDEIKIKTGLATQW